MSEELTICHIAPELQAKFVEFRFRKSKTLDALIMKINKTTMNVELEDEIEDTTVEDIVNEIPPQQPRYIGLTYPLKHDDGRVSYSLVFVFISPAGCNPELQIMYAGSKQYAQRQSGFTTEVEYRNLEDFTEESLRDQAKKFK